MEAVILLLVFFSPLAVLLLVPAALDLVMQDDRVRVWWAVPLGLWAPMVPVSLVVPLLLGPGADRWSAALYLWGTTWGMAALDLAACSMALALARGLRPGGPTERWRMGSLAFGLPVATALVALPFVVGLLSWGWMVLWAGPACWTTLVWVLALHRTGPERLERGRRAAATWIVLSSACATVGIGMVVAAGWMDLAPQPEQLLGMAVLAGLGMNALAWTVAGLGGPIARWPVGLGVAALGGSVAYAGLLFATSRLDPPGIALPAARDLRGAPAHTGMELARTVRCLEIPEQGRVIGRCLPGGGSLLAVAGDTPMRVLPPNSQILLEGGRYAWTIPSGMVADHGEPTVTVDAAGTWTVNGTTLHDKDAVHAAVAGSGWILVDAHAHLTVQGLLELCATAGPWSCFVVHR